MAAWKEMGESFKSLLRLRTEPVGLGRLEKAEEVEKIPNVVRVRSGFTYCQVPFRVRVLGQTVGVTKDDPIGDRCSRVHGLRPAKNHEAGEDRVQIPDRLHRRAGRSDSHSRPVLPQPWKKVDPC